MTPRLPAGPALASLALTALAGLALAASPAPAAGPAGAQSPPLPAKVDLVPEFRRLGLEPGVQGGRDTCSLFAIAALAAFEYAGGNPPPHAALSEEFLVWAANEATGRRGDQAMFYEAVHGLGALGICSRDLMPYEAAADAGRRPSAAALADAASRRARWKARWIRRWDVSRPMDDSQLSAVKAALAAGHPVACGLRWPVSARGRDLLAPPAPDKVRDGHSIVLAGYEDDPRRDGGGVFTFRNWNGPAWGDGGYGLISYAYVRTYANDALWLECGPPGGEVPVRRFEAESSAVAAADRCDAAPQSMRPWGRGMWSGGRQLLCRAQDGGYVELAFEAPAAGRYRICILATAAPDAGVLRASLDGRTIGPDFDLYSGRISPSGPVELGEADLAAGPHRLRLTVVGRSAASAGFSFGLDAVDLLAAP